MEKTSFLKQNRGKIAVLALLLGMVSLFHFIIPTESHFYHKIHIVLRKFNYLPPVMAGAWFGFRGAVLTTLVTSILFAFHAFLDWPGNYVEQANQIGELVSFWVVGLVSGWLFDRQRQLLTELARSHEETLLGLISALDLRERKTRLHSQRVREYTLLLAQRLGVDEKKQRIMAFAALLHDVGKIAVPDQILLKPAKLSEEEWSEMRKHPLAGYQIVKRIGFLREAAEIIYSHHEHFDGSGYPRGLIGAEIPLGARIFMVVDFFDAVNSQRAYHESMSYEETVALLQQDSGAHFDPEVVEAFLTIDRTELEVIRTRYSDERDAEQENFTEP